MFEVPSWCVGQKEKSFYIFDNGAGEVIVDLHTLRDGKAYIKGELEETMQLKAIF